MNLQSMTREQANAMYQEVGRKGGANDLRFLACYDLYFLLTRIMGRRDANHPWLYDRIREFERQPDGMLDLWARDHYKSTIITFAGTIQEILRNPEITIGVFSHTRPIATNFVRQIKTEFENNVVLQDLFPFVRPPKGTDARPWGESMLTVKRQGNPKEQTLEAWGIVQGQPTSKHFDLRIYDDLVTPESVTGPDMIKKTTDMFVLSENLGTRGGLARAIGTRYHHNDTYATLIDREVFKPRVHAATHNGQADGKPVFLTQAELNRKRRTMGSYIFGCQMLQSPSPDEGSIFKKDWVRYWTKLPERFDRTLLSLDCSFKDKADGDYVVAQAWGQLGADAYLIDQIRGLWDFVETLKQFIAFVKKYPEANERLIEDKANGPAVIDTLKDKVPALLPITPQGGKVARANAVLNGLEGNMQFQTANVFDLLPQLERAGGSPYDFIILDPPAFTKSRSTVDAAMRGYKEINYRAMKLLPRGGYLATASCSHFAPLPLFIKMLHSAAADAEVQLRQIEVRGQAPDHPVLWNVEETDYLKFFLFQVL